MISILNEIALQNEWQHFMTNTVFALKINATTTTKQKREHKIPCQTREWTPGILAPHFIASHHFTPGHQDN